VNQKKVDLIFINSTIGTIKLTIYSHVNVDLILLNGIIGST
jgi:hypothetical protein